MDEGLIHTGVNIYPIISTRYSFSPGFVHCLYCSHEFPLDEQYIFRKPLLSTLSLIL